MSGNHAPSHVPPARILRPRVVLEIARGLAVPYEDDVGARLAGLGVGDWTDILNEFPGCTISRVFRTLTLAQLRRLEDRARARDPAYETGRLMRFFTIDVPGDAATIKNVASRVRERWSGVARAHAQTVVRPPVVLSVMNPKFKGQQQESGQDYLRRAPAGIDAEYAWSQPGGDGQGLRFIDIEEGWTLDHDDLVNLGAVVIRGVDVPECSPHGTSVLGIVCATDDNAVGGVGIAPNVETVDVASYVDALPAAAGGPAAGWGASLADAITVAAARLSFGQVVLVEAQVEGPGGFQHPPELHEEVRCAIRTATSAGIVVVEAGGNGRAGIGAGVDLTKFRNSKKLAVLDPGSEDFEDSGAILVSAANPETNVRESWAPFGGRIDCWAWGRGIVTCDSIELNGQSAKDRYTEEFAGTSGASAIVAGAVLALQGVATAWTGIRLSPEEVRNALRAAGTLADAELVNGVLVQRPIGRMPDLRALLADYPRVYLRDFPKDAGEPHLIGPVDSSPDILVRPAADPPPAPDFGEPVVEQAQGGAQVVEIPAVAPPPVEIASAQPHAVYVRMRNIGGSDAHDVLARAYWTTSAELTLFSKWHLIGEAKVADVPMGGAPVVSPAIPWAAEEVPPPGACAVVVLLGTKFAPPTLPFDLLDTKNFDHLVRTTGLVACARLNVT